MLDYDGGRGRERAGRARASQPTPTAGPTAATQPSADHGVTVEDAAASVIRLANAAATVASSYELAAKRSAETARQHAAGQRQQAEQQARLTAAQKAAAASETLANVASAIAPGILCAPFDDMAAVRAPAEPLDAASYVRCGTLRLAQQSPGVAVTAPLLLPLLDYGNVVITAPGDHKGVSGVVQEIILRAFLGTGAGQLSLATYDPQLRGTTAPFTPLRQVNEVLVPPTLASPEELHDLLKELSQDIRRITEMYEGVPTTLGEFRRDVRQPIERYRLVTLLNYPSGFDDRTDAQLRTLMRTGPACGVSFIVHHDTTGDAPDDVKPDALYPLGSVIRFGNPTTIDGIDGYVADLGAAPSLAVIEPAVDLLQARAKDAAAPKISFSELQPTPDKYWQESSAERVTAIIGRAGHQAVEITLGDEREQRHNMLVSGAVGQGKSNLLMALVHSWAVRYSPQELDLYLLDFKDGVTLYPLAPHPGQEGWLPHARVLGLESDRAYGAAVLQHLVAEFERRAAIIRPYGDNITRYREAKPAASMPRIIIVIDEFQVLFEVDDDLTREALLNLERLAKKGRAYGIHLVLASQTLSGITAMLSKQDGIFGQFPIRLALKNSAPESRAVLDQQNTAAARLRYRGELVVNTDFGQMDGNKLAVVALADPTALAKLRTDLWRRTDKPTSPAVFNGAVPADLIPALEGLRLDDDDEPRALLGLPVAVSPLPVGVSFPAESGRHLSLIGAGDSVVSTESAEAGGRTSPSPTAGPVILQSAGVSLAVQHQPGAARFIVLNLLATKSKDQATVTQLQLTLRALGHEPEVVPSDGFVATLQALSDEVTLRRAGADLTPTYVLGFGMDRSPNLRVFDLATGGSPVDALHAIWREGAQFSIHLLAWWANARSYADHVGMEASGMIDAIGVLRINSQEVIDLFGPFVRWDGPTNRLLLRDVAEATDPSVVVPFAPIERDDIMRLRTLQAAR